MDEFSSGKIEHAKSSIGMKETLGNLMDAIPEKNLPREEIKKAAEWVDEPEQKGFVHHEDGDGNAAAAILALLRAEAQKGHEGVKEDIFMPMPVGQDLEYWMNVLTKDYTLDEVVGAKGGLAVVDMNDSMLFGALKSLGVDTEIVKSRMDHHQRHDDHPYESGQVVPDPGLKMDSTSLLCWAVAQEFFKTHEVDDDVKEAIDKLAIIGLMADKKHLHDEENNPLMAKLKELSDEDYDDLDKIAKNLNYISIRPTSEEKQDEYKKAIEVASSELLQVQSSGLKEVSKNIGTISHIENVRNMIANYNVMIAKKPSLFDKRPPKGEYAKVKTKREQYKHGRNTEILLDEKDQTSEIYLMTEALWKDTYDINLDIGEKGTVSFGILSKPELHQGYVVQKLDFRFGTLDLDDEAINARSVTNLNATCGGHSPRAGGILYVVIGQGYDKSGKIIPLEEDTANGINMKVEEWKDPNKLHKKESMEVDEESGDGVEEEIYFVTSPQQAFDMFKARAEGM